MIPRNKKTVNDLLVAAALIALGLLLPNELQGAGFQAHLGGVAVGIGLGWLIKSLIENKSRIENNQGVVP